MTLVLVQHGSWPGWSPNADIYLESRGAAAFFTAARDYMAETRRAMPEIAEPMGGERTVAETTEMQWAFDYGPHGMHRATATAAQKAKSAALYTHYNMSTVSTARPAITGTHTTGLFFDVATQAFLAWLLINGHRYGITRPLLNDPNHCQVSPGTETVALDEAGLGNARKELDMIGLNYNDSGAPAQVGTKILIDFVNRTGYYPNADEQSIFTQSGGVFVNVNDKMWTYAVAPLRITQSGKSAAATGGGSSPTDYFSDADAAALLKTVTDALAAGDTKVLAAISGAPAQVLASFGLQRIKA